MKKLLILLFSLLISFHSYGEWEEVVEGENGDIYYLDEDSIKNHGGYVYFWEMRDYLKPTDTGTMSGKMYKQGDCGVNREKHLSFSYYKEPMGRGSGTTMTPSDEWMYPSPGTVRKLILDYVCDYIN
jgi:hypothetical protein